MARAGAHRWRVAMPVMVIAMMTLALASRARAVEIVDKATPVCGSGEGDALWLNGHEVTCDRESQDGEEPAPLMGFSHHVVNHNENKNMAYMYSCARGVNVGRVETRMTTFRHYENVLWFDQHDVNCEDKPLVAFLLQRNEPGPAEVVNRNTDPGDGSMIRYWYRCGRCASSRVKAARFSAPSRRIRTAQTELPNGKRLVSSANFWFLYLYVYCNKTNPSGF